MPEDGGSAAPGGAALDTALYRTVALIRRFEERAIELARSGEIASGIHPCIGQEAVAAGVCAWLRPGDVLVTHHRGHGHTLAKGTDPGALLAELCGRVTGVNRGRSNSFHPADPASGVYIAGGTVGHLAGLAAGAAWALAQEDADAARCVGADAADDTARVVACFFGDGAMNQGALLEALNLAALWQVPAVFACERNGYAATVPIEATLAGTITGRAAAFGIPAQAVDGMDPVAVAAAARQAVHLARAGGGPTLLELRTYRFGAHHTFEEKTLPCYREDAEIEAWRERDPVALQGARLPAWRRREIDAEIQALLDDAVAVALAGPRPDPADSFDYLYADGLRVRPGTPC
jgi:pyruvate dehydrogenase E1 component alpha subunit